MAGTKDYQFEGQSLYNLLVHYTGGEIPLNGELREFLVHPSLTRKIGLLVESEEWETSDPLFLHYDGKRITSWTKGNPTSSPVEMNERPRRQN